MTGVKPGRGARCDLDHCRGVVATDGRRSRGRRRVSLFQALTQIQEQTLVFVPKILAIS